MKPVINHPWNLSEQDAFELQKTLSGQIIQDDQFDEIKLIAGVDVAYSKETDKLIAAVVILDATTLEVIESVTAEDVEQFPYIPGLFSFRELPSLIKAFAKLKNTPDLVVCDGQGLAHPRRFGLACHLGLIFDVPAIGCGKKRLCGFHDELNAERGSIAHLVDNDEVIGCALRTKKGINPIFVSIGHRISLQTACDWVLRLTPEYRQPETTRQADQLVKLTLKALESTTDLD